MGLFNLLRVRIERLANTIDGDPLMKENKIGTSFSGIFLATCCICILYLFMYSVLKDISKYIAIIHCLFFSEKDVFSLIRLKFIFQ